MSLKSVKVYLRLMSQPDCSIEMSSVKVKLAITESGCCVCEKKEWALLCLVFSYFYLYTACASSLASRHQSLDESPLLNGVTSWSGER